MRIETIDKVIVPFRAPEIQKAIVNYDLNEYFYFDQQWDVNKRFDIIDEFDQTLREWVTFDLPDYNFYSTAGSTEAIVYCLLTAKFESKKIAMLEDDYRWYPLICNNLEIPFDIVKEPSQITSDHIFVTSTPFCKDGSVSDLQLLLLDYCEQKNIEVWLDFAYYGAGKLIDIDITKNVRNIFFSFSKNFALALNRIGVWLTSDRPIDRVVLNNVAYLNLANMGLASHLMKQFPPDFLWNNYRELQLSVTNSPTDIICLSEEGCITKLLLDKVKANYQYF